MYNEEDYLLLSGIQHFMFCRRQWALIHIEQKWNENLYTIEGNIMHEKTHTSSSEKRDNLVITRSLPVSSRTLGISGICDVVEFHKCEDGVTLFKRDGLYTPFPVEYKRGKPKKDECDILQLCAQAICLEEMLSCKILEGALFYGETRHRLPVIFDEDLRSKVTDMFKEMHTYHKRGYTPKVKRSKACKSCSLEDLCVPKLNEDISVQKYIDNMLREGK